MKAPTYRVAVLAATASAAEAFAPVESSPSIATSALRAEAPAIVLLSNFLTPAPASSRIESAGSTPPPRTPARSTPL